MSITSKINFKRLPQNDFHRLDHIVMRHAFDIQNELGRFCSEKIYQRELADRCINDSCGLINTVTTEAPILVKHKRFEKTYYTDLVVNDSIIYELKTVKAFSDAHRAQAINYLLLANLPHAKLINFSSSSVESEYVSTTFTFASRKEFHINTKQWQPTSRQHNLFKDLLRDIASDIGLSLDITLYNDIMSFLREERFPVIQPIDIICSNKVIGQQPIHLFDADTAFKISAITSHHNAYKKNIIKLLNHTKLNSVLWANLEKHQITFETISK